MSIDKKFGILSSILNNHSIAGGLVDTVLKKKTKQDRYFSLMRGINMYSHSTSESLNRCERLHAINKLRLASRNAGSFTDPFVFESNMDLAFGKTVESGVQSALLGKSRVQVFFDMFLSWEMPLDALHPKGYKKTWMDAVIAIDSFFWIKEEMFKGWEIAFFNGKPAIELSFCINLGNGYYYVGHADIILYNSFQRAFKVLENKTTNAWNVHEAMYKNSTQAVGYSVVLDSIAKDAEQTGTFEVFYLVYSSHENKFIPFEFTKSRSNRAAWINTLLMDIQRIDLCKKTGFWPKRGNACFDFRRPCEYFDTCDLGFENFNESGEFDVISEEEIEKHEFDFKFTLKEIIETQKELI